MSAVLERLGRLAARRPWLVIATWAAVLPHRPDRRGFLRSGARRPVRGTRARLTACHRAADTGRRRRHGPRRRRRPHAARPVGEPLRLPSGADRCGQRPGSPGRAAPRARHERPGQRARCRPAVRSGSGVVSAGGEVALVRVQYPGRADLSPPTWRRLKATLDDLRRRRPLRIEAGGDLYFAFEQPPAGVGEALGLVVAVVILLLAFGSIVAMGLPIGTALFGLAVGAGSLSAGGLRHRHPQLGGRDRIHGRAGRRHRLRAVHPDPLPGVPRARAATSRTPSAARWPPLAGRSSSPAAPSSWRSWASPSPGSRSSPPGASASP